MNSNFLRQISNRSFGIDTRSLAAFRIGLGILFLCDLCARIQYLIAFHTDDGIMPRTAIDELNYTWSFSLLNVFQSSLYHYIFFFVSALIAFSLIIGYRTQLSTLLAWIALISIQNDNLLVLQVGDTFFRQLLLFGIFLPLGASYSIDNFLKDHLHPMYKQKILTCATVVLILQICFLYFFAALLQDSTLWWPKFEAVYLSFQLEQFVTPFGAWFRENIPKVLFKPATAFIYILELMALPLFILPFPIIRFFTAIALVFTNIILFICMDFGLFPLINIISLFVFIPSFFWDSLTRKIIKRQKGTIIYYDADCLFCFNMVRALKFILFLPGIPIEEAQKHINANRIMENYNSWVLRTKNKRYLTGFDAIIEVTKLSITFSFTLPLLFLFSVIGVGDKTYKFVANNRNRLGPLTKPYFSLRPNSYVTNTPIQLFVLSIILIIGFWNVSNLPGHQFSFPNYLKPIVYMLRIDQKWAMFNPKPPHYSKWYVMIGQLRDGTEVDTWNNTIGNVSFKKPRNVSSNYKTERWRQYLWNLSKQKYKNHQLNLANYLCLNWNNGIENESYQLVTHQIYFIEESISVEYRNEPKPTLFFKHHCFK
ncbi:DCC1-like thiol-disulfide oxidoreductase family protein [Bacteriovoracaceae bacterium]|nr:DCC1-like thiol-disulfide oxidoreductase family protein [Bacteriovoracaceae bacterium]